MPGVLSWPVYYFLCLAILREPVYYFCAWRFYLDQFIIFVPGGSISAGVSLAVLPRPVYYFCAWRFYPRRSTWRFYPDQYIISFYCTLGGSNPTRWLFLYMAGLIQPDLPWCISGGSTITSSFIYSCAWWAYPNRSTFGVFITTNCYFYLIWLLDLLSFRRFYSNKSPYFILHHLVFTIMSDHTGGELSQGSSSFTAHSNIPLL